MLRNPNPSVITVVLLAVVLAVFAGVGYSAPGGNGKGDGQGGQVTTTDASTSTSSNTTTSNTSTGGGKGQGKNDPVSADCSFSNNVVTVTGLPVWTVINFLITDSSGGNGWVLGMTDDGTWAQSVPAPTGPTTYQFISSTWGPNGSKYSVYATCSA